uniref:F-box domain-containing protein n=1 Tax=Panagrellus redivivus TaxID=6233 RepID=A0A7E4W3B6_PANRE
MDSTLNPNLLVEVIALRREYLLPQNLCGLFLADRNFSEAFALAFRYRCDVLYDGSSPYSQNLSVKTRGGITFYFDRVFHIPALLRIAGRLMHRMNGRCPDGPWIEPFFEGLDENRSLEHIVCGGEHFLQRYAQHHDSISRLTLDEFSWLDHLKDFHIGTLVVRYSSKTVNIIPCNVTHIETIDRPTCYNPLTASDWLLIKFNKELLKSVTYRGMIDFDVALRMFRALKSAEELTFHKVRVDLPHETELIDRVLNRVGPYINKFWSTMLTHPGTVTVNAVFERRMSVRTRDAFILCTNRSFGYTVTESHHQHFVQCTHQKMADMKVLNVDLKFDCVNLNVYLKYHSNEGGLPGRPSTIWLTIHFLSVDVSCTRSFATSKRNREKNVRDVLS